MAKSPVAPKLERALHAYDELEQSGKPPTIETVAQQAGVGTTTAEKAVSIKRQAAEIQPLDPATAAPSVRERMEAWQRAERKRMRLEIEAELEAKHTYRNEEWLKSLHKHFDEANQIKEAFRGLMPKRDYQLIVRCLHPDAIAHLHPPADLVRRFETAFRLFTQHEKLLVKPEVIYSGPPVPETAADLIRQKQRMDEARRAAKQARA